MKLKLSSKKLSSGRYQVRFSVDGFDHPCYGYLLADPHATVSGVVEKIRRHVFAMQSKEAYFQRNLYSLHSRNVHSGRILVFAQ